MSTPRNPKNTHPLIQGIIASLIAAALFSLSLWLPKKMVKIKPTLLLSSDSHKVGDLSSWYIELSNNTEVAFDVKLDVSKLMPIEATFSPSQNTDLVWKGSLEKDKKVKGLVIFNSIDTSVSNEILRNHIKSTYKERDTKTGKIVSHSTEVRNAQSLRLTNFLQLLFWFLLPYGVMTIPLLSKKVRLYLGLSRAKPNEDDVTT